MDENENESSTAERFERAIKSEGTVTVTPEMAREWLAAGGWDKYDVDAIFTKHIGINLTEKLIGLKVEIARVVTELQDKLDDSDSLKESAQDNLVKLRDELEKRRSMSEAEKDSLRDRIEELKEELKRSREFTKKQYLPLMERVEKLKENNNSLSREAGRLREENLQLNRYNNDLLVSERNLRTQIDELNANIDDREKTCFSADQVVALMIAAVTE